MTVCGDISPSKMGVALASESLVRDQSGAEADAVSHYDMESAFRAILPELMQLKQLGGGTVIDTVSVYAGRNVKFLQRLSKASELNVLTNTGYDGTEGNKYVPIELQKESAEDIAARYWKLIATLRHAITKEADAEKLGELMEAVSKAERIYRKRLRIIRYAKRGLPHGRIAEIFSMPRSTVSNDISKIKHLLSSIKSGMDY